MRVGGGVANSSLTTLGSQPAQNQPLLRKGSCPLGCFSSGRTTHMFIWPCGKKQWSVGIIRLSPQGRPGALLLTRRLLLELSSKKKGLMYDSATWSHRTEPKMFTTSRWPRRGYSRARLAGRTVWELRGPERRGCRSESRPLDEEHWAQLLPAFCLPPAGSIFHFLEAQT